MKIVGNTIKTQRIVTGLYSFDHAFQNAAGDIGFPLGTITEISGPTGCGKSTLTLGLSGMIATALQSDIALVDLEGFDVEFMEVILNTSKFDGSLHIVQEDTDEATLDSLLTHLDKDCSVGILDSIGGISPIAEAEGNLGEANMGKRAKLMAQMARKSTRILTISRKKTLFMINHVHVNIGGMGTITPGGETVKYLSSVRFRIKRKEEVPDQSYLIEGSVFKNRFGYRDRKFYIFMLAGIGIHQGMTDLFDCFTLGLAERGKVVKVDGKSHGYLKDFLKAAHEGNTEVFMPFKEKLFTAGLFNQELPEESIPEEILDKVES